MRDDRLMRLARRIAEFGYDYDAYGFMDASEVGESTEEALERITMENYRLLQEGDYDSFTDWVDTEALDDRELLREWNAILRELRFLRLRRHLMLPMKRR